MRRGDVCWADLEPRSGSEQRGRRPVVVVSHDAFNQVPGWRSLIVVPLTASGRQAARGPTVVPLAAAETRLCVESFAVCHQITTIDRGKLGEPVGSLGGAALQLIGQAILRACDIRLENSDPRG
jgi:mRNA-degrading endonuclease toxin of MazEF toxin-antitoxin module